MSIEVVKTCPLGSECEEIKDGKLHRCRWFIEMAGKTQDGKDVNSWDCAISWQPILMVEMSSTSRNVSASVDSLRNETVGRQDAALKIIKGNSDAKEIINQ